MAKLFVGMASDFENYSKKLVEAEEKEIFVIRVEDRFFAYENMCPHQGGPACEGKLMKKVEAVLSEDKSLVEERFSRDEFHIVCPWHGYEYDLKTGQCIGDRKLKLKKYNVINENGKILLEI